MPFLDHFYQVLRNALVCFRAAECGGRSSDAAGRAFWREADYAAPCGSAISISQKIHQKRSCSRATNLFPLTEAEVAAVDDGVAAMEKLLEELADVPTPDCPTPRELQIRTILRPKES